MRVLTAVLTFVLVTLAVPARATAEPGGSSPALQAAGATAVVVPTSAEPGDLAPSAVEVTAELLAAQPFPRPGPGLGTSKADPSGTPITLVLPDGYALVEVHGGSGDRPAPEGAFDVVLVLQFDMAAYQGERSNAASCATEPEWSGWLMWSIDDEAQNIWIPSYTCWTEDGELTPILELPVPAAGDLVGGTATVRFSVGGYCVNLDRHAPDTEYLYRVGVVSDDPGLGIVLEAVEGKDLRDAGNIFTIQDVIWDYTDFEGLTRENLDRLAELT